MTPCRTEKETVSRMEKAGPFDCWCSRQSMALPSLCLCQGSRWTLWAHFVVFSCIIAKLMLQIFLIWGFTVWLFCMSPKYNLSETFYALFRWGVRWKTRSCLLNHCQKLEHLVQFDDAILKGSWLFLCGHTVFYYRDICQTLLKKFPKGSGMCEIDCMIFVSVVDCICFSLSAV